MRLFNWPSLCAVASVTIALAGCSSPASTTPPPGAATGIPATEVAVPPALAPAPVPAAEPGRAPDATAPRIGAAPAARPSARPSPGEPPAANSTPTSVSPAPVPSAPPAPTFTEITVPSGTTLAIELKSAHASDTSRLEETVRGVLRRPLLVNGEEIAPAGTRVTGHVTAVDQSARVKGRARLALRFSSIVIDEADLPMTTATIAREAAATKKDDAAKIGIGAGAGALIGAIKGGRKGAVVGGTIGAGAGTGVVLATRGDEVELAAGTSVSTTLSRPLVVRVRVP